MSRNLIERPWPELRAFAVRVGDVLLADLKAGKWDRIGIDHIEGACDAAWVGPQDETLREALIVMIIDRVIRLDSER